MLFVRSVIALLIASLFLLIFCHNFYREIFPESDSPSLMALMGYVDCSQPPCLLGRPVQNLDQTEIEDFLGGSDLVDKTTLYVDEGYIEWRWSSDIAFFLGMRPLGGYLYDYRPFNVNAVTLSNSDYFARVTTAFEIHFNEFVKSFGPPEHIEPYTYDHWGNMYLLLFFNDQIFVAITRCDKPRLRSDTLIVGHISISPVGFKQLFTNDGFAWKGWYTNDLPHCDVFQP